MSKGLPPPELLSSVSVGSGDGADVEVSVAGGAVDSAEEVVVCDSSDEVGGPLEEVVSGSSSVCAAVVDVDVVAWVEAAVVVVDGGRSVLDVCGGLLEVGVTTKVVLVVIKVVLGASVELALELELSGASSGEALGHSKPTRFPSKACPNTEAARASTSPHTTWTVCWILASPLTHSAEHAPPSTKSSTEQPGIRAL